MIMKRGFLFWTIAAMSVLTCGRSFAQEEHESAEVYLEEYTDEFQENFFEALKQKGIQNYDRAIDLFLKCKQLEGNNSVVDYELAKAYCLDGQFIKAQEYAIAALISEPTDFWYLDNLIKILDEQGSPMETVKQRIPYENRKLQENLAVSYFKKRKYDEALKVLKELGSSEFTSDLTEKINDSLHQQGKNGRPAVVSDNNQRKKDDPVAQYQLQIERLLEKPDYKSMLVVSEEALDAYPLQPYFYYAYGTALNNTSNANKAIEVLESGLDYLLDDDQLANKIYRELSKAYTNIGNDTKANEYANKVKPGL